MNKYEQWLEVSDKLKAIKAEELKLRNELCESILKDKYEGAISVEDEGFKITATAKLTRSIDAATLESVWDDLSEAEKECIKYKPSLDVSGFKRMEMHGHIHALFDAVTVKPAQATLTIKPLKKEEE